MAILQLDFFEQTDFSALRARVEKVEMSTDRVRKKQFAEIGELKKLVTDIDYRLKIIEVHICKEK